MATKACCRRLWTSFGIFMQVMPFFTQSDQCMLQCLNRFFYNSAVSRVQTAFNIVRPAFFTWWIGYNNAKTLFKLDKQLKPYRVSGPNLQLQNFMTVQVKAEVFGFEHRVAEPRFIKIAGIYRVASVFEVSEKTKPLEPRAYPSLVNFHDSFIFVSGGLEVKVVGAFEAYLKSVNVYDISKGEWRNAPPLH